MDKGRWKREEAGFALVKSGEGLKPKMRGKLHKIKRKCKNE
jgi:hypothetical protein